VLIARVHAIGVLVERDVRERLGLRTAPADADSALV
jgi:hypothetical protein